MCSSIIMESNNDKILFFRGVQDGILWIVHAADLWEIFKKKHRPFSGNGQSNNGFWSRLWKLLLPKHSKNTTTLLTTVQQDKGLLTARSTLQQCVYLTSDLHVTPIELRYVICIKKSFCLQFHRSRKVRLQCRILKKKHFRIHIYNLQIFFNQIGSQINGFNICTQKES